MSGNLSPGAVFAGCRIDEPIARGGMGVVYRATQLEPERPVALKVILPEFAADRLFRERFKREARLAATLDHPSVIPVYEAGEVDGRLFLVMRFIQGTDLDVVIKSERRLHPGHAVPILEQVASALDAAHALGLVHRDVKPGNVMLARGERGESLAYLTDFGLSKMTASQTGLTKTGRWVGTVDYAAPEQVQAGDTDARTDVYALGCVFFEALSGDVPFPRRREVLKIIAHISEEPPSLDEVAPDCPGAPQLASVIGKALAKEPGERYASAGAFARAARAAVSDVPAPARDLDVWATAEASPEVDRSAPTAG